MKCEIIDNTVRLIPENDEIEKFNQLFPANYLRTSKVVKSKGFVDKFGKPTGTRYLTIRGYDEDDAGMQKPLAVESESMQA